MNAPRAVPEWMRAAELAAAELDSFDRRWAGVVFRSKNHERRSLVAALEDARLGLLRAVHATETEPTAPVAPATPSSRDEAGYPTVEEILSAKAELEAVDRTRAGARTIARRLGCHESTVRRRLGRRK